MLLLDQLVLHGESSAAPLPLDQAFAFQHVVGLSHGHSAYAELFSKRVLGWESSPNADGSVEKQVLNRRCDLQIHGIGTVLFELDFPGGGIRTHRMLDYFRKS